MFPKHDESNSITPKLFQLFIRMGTACSFSGAGTGSNSYDFPERQSPCHEAQSAHDHAFDEKQTQCKPESLTNDEQIVSQSQCEVNITEGSSHIRDPDLENSKTVNNTETMNQTSALEGVPPQAATVNAEERLLVEDFKPGHVSHVDNAFEKQSSGHAKTSDVDGLLNVLARTSDGEIEKVVDECWQDIENTCRKQRDRTSSSTELKTKGWKVVRLFVSSTFADYHAEREVLVKKVCLTSVRILCYI